VPIEVAAHRGLMAETSTYVGDKSADRYAFLAAITRELDARGWHFKPDTGWHSHDLEIFGGKWSRLRLTTATEEPNARERIVRCRLVSTWSFRARLTFSVLLGVELVAIGLWQSMFPWLWLTLVLQVLVGWYLTHQNEFVHQRVWALIDRVAEQQRLTRVRESETPA
jgi:hypothetical protein